MSKKLQLRGGTTTEHASFTGANREVTVDTDKETLVIHDGSTVGGFPLPRTDAEIRTAVEAATDSNVFTDADHSKLNAIEASATADQTDAEIRAAVEAATDSNVFTDADHTKLNAIEASADVTDTANVVAALTAGANITIAANGTIAGAAQYTHPTYAGDDAGIDTGALSGATVISDLDLNITTDTLGHVTDANATVSTRNLTLGNLGYTGATNANYITNNNQLTNGRSFVASSGFKTVGGLTIIGSGDISVGVSPPDWSPTTTPNITYTSSATWSRPSSVPKWIIVIMVGGGGYSSYYPGYGWSIAGSGGAANAFAGYGSEFPTSLSFVVGAGGIGGVATGTLTDAGKTYTTVNGTYLEAVGGKGVSYDTSDTYRHNVASTGGGMGVPFGGTPGRFWSSLNTDSGQGGGDVERPENNAVVGGGGGGGKQNKAGGLSTFSGNGGNGSSGSSPQNGATGGGGAGCSNSAGANGGSGSVRIWYVN
tara:strand:+ start:929 stop:2377 length:1449 start_codon:yes stop_codon:yes gene_type:complete